MCFGPREKLETVCAVLMNTIYFFADEFLAIKFPLLGIAVICCGAALLNKSLVRWPVITWGTSNFVYISTDFDKDAS